MDELFQMVGDMAAEVIFGVAAEIVSEGGFEYRPATWLASGPEFHSVVPGASVSSEWPDESL
jgi:hypothetical protein